jgi:secondary thiamine-phosphate synthase enzyme
MYFFAGMEWLKEELEVRTPGQGLHDFTSQVEDQVRKWRVTEGMCHLYLRHTSASLLISENYDPTARRDLEEFLRRIAPENQPWHAHTLEGADDSPSHMRALLTGTSESIPVDDGRLSLGQWQGIYLCEHRRAPHRRRVLLRCLKVA